MDADHYSETTRRRSGDGYEGRGCPPVEKHQLFVGFLAGAQNGGGLGLGLGAGLTEVASCRGRDCSTLRLRPWAASSVAAAKDAADPVGRRI